MEVAAEAATEEKPSPEEPTEPIEKPQSPAPASHESALEEDGIDHMDFEEISDEELEEEVKVKGIGDALGVDWASLVAESRPRVKQDKCGAKKRWESHRVLMRVGLSSEMAGEKLVKEILREAKMKEDEEMKKEGNIKEEEVKEEIKKEEEVKEEIKEIKDEIKEEPKEVVKEEEVDVTVSHPIAAIQVALREKEVIRNNLFATAGTYRRALSARRDLAIRRHLCNLPIKDLSVDRPKTPEDDMFKLASQLMLRSL